jgi:hypothetical protein
MRGLLLAALALAGCTSSIATVAPHTTASQQLIEASAEQAAVDSLPATLPSRKAYIDASSFDGSKYELAAFKLWLLEQGIALAADAKSANMVVVPYTAADGYNVKSLLVGIPAFKLAALMSTPEIALYARTTELAISQLNFYAYDEKSGALVVAAKSKFGLQTYSITRVAFFFDSETPKIDPRLLQRDHPR